MNMDDNGQGPFLWNRRLGSLFKIGFSGKITMQFFCVAKLY